jgi:hypothetical protein
MRSLTCDGFRQRLWTPVPSVLSIPLDHPWRNISRRRAGRTAALQAGVEELFGSNQALTHTELFR